MNVLRKLERWHQTTAGLAAFGLIELALAYVCGSWAIDSGRLLAWFLLTVLLVGVLQNFGRLVRKVITYAR